MSTNKKISPKIVIIIFALIFVIVFLLVSGGAVFSILGYEAQNIPKNIWESLTTPPKLNFWQNIGNKSEDKEIEQPIVTTTPTPKKVVAKKKVTNFDTIMSGWDFNLFPTEIKATPTPTKKTINTATSTKTTTPSSTQPEIKKQPEAEIASKDPLPNIPAEALNQNILQIPKFKIVAPIIESNTTDLNTIYKKLNSGVVLYPGSDTPGKGHAIILGHSANFAWAPGKYKTVFSLLSQLSYGDQFYIFWEGRTLVYKVIDKEIFLPNVKDGKVAETLFEKPKQSSIILQSCWPVGVNSKRIAVQAVLVNTN